MSATTLPGIRAKEVAGSPVVRRRRLGPGKPIKFGAAIGPVLLLAVWSIGSATGWIDPRSLTAPWTVVTTVQRAVSDRGSIQIKRAIPSLALLPLLILWLGIGEGMKIVTILLGVFVPIYIHTHNGLRTIDARYVELAQTVGLSQWDFIRR